MLLLVTMCGNNNSQHGNQNKPKKDGDVEVGVNYENQFVSIKEIKIENLKFYE